MSKSQKTILVAEDETALRHALVAALRASSFSVMEAKNGEEGLASALKHHPDLILLDILMPDMDGMTMLKKLRTDAWGKNAPVIILTNLNPTDETVIRDVATHKPLHYFIKSDWQLKDIIKEIHKVFA